MSEETNRGTSERSPGGNLWFRAGLAVGGALLAQELSEHWGRHLKPTDFYPLSLAIGMSLYNWHLIRLRPPKDDRSILRAIWLPEQKRQALWITLGVVVLSMIYLGTRLNRPVKELTFDDIYQLRPISSGLHTVSGTPRQDKQHYRWAFAGVHDSSDAPYLTPLKEFKGQVLVISEEPLKQPLTDHRGWLTEVSPLSQKYYDGYRKYMGLSSEVPIYLFDLRGLWWFDPYGFAAALASLLFLMITLGSATRDPNNQSRLLYIPPELRGGIDTYILADEKTGNDDIDAEISSDDLYIESRDLEDAQDELSQDPKEDLKSQLEIQPEVQPEVPAQLEIPAKTESSSSHNA